MKNTMSFNVREANDRMKNCIRSCNKNLSKNKSCTESSSKSIVDLKYKTLHSTYNSLVLYKTTFVKTLKQMEVPSDDFQSQALFMHNKLRTVHQAPPLEWSNKLYKGALSWAIELADSNTLAHGDSDCGENLACYSGMNLDGGQVTYMWYNEIKHYDFGKAGYTNKTGHFTQVVWVDSKLFAIAQAIANDGTIYVVARYSPPGNFQGKFKENVRRPISSGNISSSSGPEFERSYTYTVESRQDATELPVQILKLHNDKREYLNMSHINYDQKLEELAKLKAQALANNTQPANTAKSCYTINLKFTGYCPTKEDIFSEILTITFNKSSSNNSSTSLGTNIVAIPEIGSMGCYMLQSETTNIFVAVYTKKK